MNALLPRKTGVPPDDGTWATIVAIEGHEANRLYRRVDPRSGRLVLDREFVVRQGTPALYGPRDIHSIHVAADRHALLFYLYGRALETLTARVGFDLTTGGSYSYNKKHFRPSVKGGKRTA